MLTKEQIEAQALETYSFKAYKDYARAYALGAAWANEQNAQEIAELKEHRAQSAAKWYIEAEGYKAKIAELVDALRALYDEQNGCPLETRRQNWEAAIKKAQEILFKHGK